MASASSDDDVLALVDAMRVALAEAPPPGGPLLQLEELPLTDPWEPDVSELNLLARPYLERCGLDHLDVFVELWDGDEKLRGLPDDKNTRPAHHPSVWFDSVVEGLCIFAGEASAVESTAACIADFAHAAAAAYWHQRGIRAPFPSRRAELLDVTAVLLGFGPSILVRPPALEEDAVRAVIADEVRRGHIGMDELTLAVAARQLPGIWSRLTDS